MPEGVIDFLTFIALWVGLMALIGAALAVTRLFRKKEEERPVDPKEYAEKMDCKVIESAVKQFKVKKIVEPSAS